MHLDSLHIQGLRNFESQDFRDFGLLNFFHGINGSGKTSVLEAIHMLSLTRSFRSRKVANVINFKADHVLLRAALRSPSGDGRKGSLGIRRGRDKTLLVKYGGERLRSYVDMAGLLPVQLINPDSFQLLEGAPSVRRQFLDWSVFHVKHFGFYEDWSRYRRALQQRNSLLRRGKLDDSLFMPWELELASTGARISAFRRKQFGEICAEFSSIYQRLCGAVPNESGDTLELEQTFISGLPDGNSDSEEGFLQSLIESRQQDFRQGFTRVGPHRADIKIRCNKLLAADVLSRGQVKTFVCALKLAQVKVLQNYGLNPLLLIDDLPAELDRYRCAAIFKEVDALGCQLFATSIHEADLSDEWLRNGASPKRFHVEH